MSDVMEFEIKRTRKSVTIGILQNEVEALQDELRRLEALVAAVSIGNIEKTHRDVEALEPPHEAIGKCQMCKSCKHMRLPHRSNAHYTCDMRHTTIEPKLTCGSYEDKKNKDTQYCSH